MTGFSEITNCLFMKIVIIAKLEIADFKEAYFSGLRCELMRNMKESLKNLTDFASFNEL